MEKRPKGRPRKDDKAIQKSIRLTPGQWKFIEMISTKTRLSQSRVISTVIENIAMYEINRIFKDYSNEFILPPPSKH